MNELVLLKGNRSLRKLTDEEWRFYAIGINRYKVSNYGRVKSFAFEKENGKILKGGLINGFKQVAIHDGKRARTLYIHKMVAETWIPRPSEEHKFVTHLDGILSNNKVSNLEWHTRESLRLKHRELAKLRPKIHQKRKITNSKLTMTDISHLKAMLERGVVQAVVAKLFGISAMQVSRIKSGENWGYVLPAEPTISTE